MRRQQAAAAAVRPRTARHASNFSAASNSPRVRVIRIEGGRARSVSRYRIISFVSPTTGVPIARSSATCSVRRETSIRPARRLLLHTTIHWARGRSARKSCSALRRRRPTYRRVASRLGRLLRRLPGCADEGEERGVRLAPTPIPAAPLASSLSPLLKCEEEPGRRDHRAKNKFPKGTGLPPPTCVCVCVSGLHAQMRTFRRT